MRQFVKRALQRISELDNKKGYDFIITASREIDRLETVLDSLPGGVLVCDTSHKLILANKAARRLLSIVSYEQARETVWSVIPCDLVAEHIAGELVAAGKAEEREFEVDVAGRQRLLSVGIMPLVQNRRVSGSLILVEDVTEKKGREARMRRMENLASLTTLAAGVAHEVKNPLGSISIHVQLIQKALAAQEKLCMGTLKERYPEARQDPHSETREGDDFPCEPGAYFGQIEKYLGIVNEEVERLNAIVVDFLFAVRPMNAKLLRGNINAFIVELAEFVSHELKEAGIAITLILDENLSELDFDTGLLKQAILNLINNAAAAMGGGGELTIATGEKDGEAEIIVSDTGTGIPEENLSKIFEPYFTTKDSGTGLGLTLVFKIVKEHGGEISVKSQMGEGTVFTITLPVPQSSTRLIAFNSGEAAFFPEWNSLPSENKIMENQ